jgi:hypothetical protein
MSPNANAGPLAGFIAHTGIETAAEPLFKNSLFGFRFMCPGCTQPLRHPHIADRMYCECKHCRRGYVLEMYPPQREQRSPEYSHTFTHLFYVVVSRHEYERYAKRLEKLERGDAANNRPQMKRAFLRKLGALEIFEAGPPPAVPQSPEQRDRDYAEWQRQQGILRQMNEDIVEQVQPGVIMKKAR